MLAQGRGWCAVSKKPKLIQIIRKGDPLVRINPAFSSPTLEVYFENGKDLFGTLKQISVQPTTELTRCASRNGGNSQVPKDLLGTLKQILGKLRAELSRCASRSGTVLQNRHRILQRLVALLYKEKKSMQFDNQYFNETVKQRLSVTFD